MDEHLRSMRGMAIFENQPRFSKSDWQRLEKLGYIGPRGDVAGWSQLAQLIKERGIDQDDAKRLLMLETLRAKQPRASHFRLLIKKSFDEDKRLVKNRIVELCQPDESIF